MARHHRRQALSKQQPPTTTNFRFFDLPYELRLMIYEHMLPPSRMLPFFSLSSTLGGRKIEALCAASNRLKQEFSKIASQQYDLTIKISPHLALNKGILQKCKIDFEKLSRLEIVVDHYDQNWSNSIQIMRMKAGFLTQRLKRYNTLPSVEIRFLDNEIETESTISLDRYWCDAPDRDGIIYPKLSNSNNGDDVEIVNHIIEPLMDLPPIKNPLVPDIVGLKPNPDRVNKTERWLRSSRIERAKDGWAEYLVERLQDLQGWNPAEKGRKGKVSLAKDSRLVCDIFEG